MIDQQTVIDFWFAPEVVSKHWVKDPEFDQEIRDRFLSVHTQACSGQLVSWRDTAHGRLAEIIILDQFSRNMFRDQPEAFACDAMALELALAAIAANAQIALKVEEKAFLYLPLMHSESKEMHEKAVELFSEPGLENNLKFEYMHKKIIDQFGRYPHRNQILGRESTPEEIMFLQEPGSSF